MKYPRTAMRWLPAVAAALALAVWLCIPSKPEEERYVRNMGDGTTTPTMATTDVSTFISDSGYTKYHLTADLWQLFDDAEEPFWKFPYGLFMEQYDRDMRIESSVVCDSATYLSRKRIWRLDGNVVMVNTDADSFLTQQLFWDQNARKIYSDSFIHIVRSDRTIEGYGFESDQSMKYYTVNNPTAILPGNLRHNTDADSTGTATADTVRTAPATPRQRASEAATMREYPGSESSSGTGRMSIDRPAYKTVSPSSSTTERPVRQQKDKKIESQLKPLK